MDQLAFNKLVQARLVKRVVDGTKLVTDRGVKKVMRGKPEIYGEPPTLFNPTPE